jgi:hypothetical protein
MDYNVTHRHSCAIHLVENMIRGSFFVIWIDFISSYEPPTKWQRLAVQCSSSDMTSSNERPAQ